MPPIPGSGGGGGGGGTPGPEGGGGAGGTPNGKLASCPGSRGGGGGAGGTGADSTVAVRSITISSTPFDCSCKSGTTGGHTGFSTPSSIATLSRSRMRSSEGFLAVLSLLLCMVLCSISAGEENDSSSEKVIGQASSRPVSLDGAIISSETSSLWRPGL